MPADFVVVLKDSKCRSGNYFSAISFQTSISLETDPLLYILKAKSATNRKKHSLQAAFNHSITAFIFSTFGTKIGAILPRRTVSKTTTYISNMIGLMEEVNILDNPIAYIASSVSNTFGEESINNIFPKLCGKDVNLDRARFRVIPNPYKLCNCMEDSLQTMTAALSERELL